MESTTAEQFLGQAIGRASDSEAVTKVVRDISSALAGDEVVLEAADCTVAREPSAVVVTNRQLLLGVGPGQLKSVDLARLTSYSFNVEPDSSFRLVLRIFDARLTWAGFDPNGMRRISHALDWVFGHHRDTHLADSAETSIGDSYDTWRALQQKFQDTPELSAAERHAGLIDVLANKRWW